MAAVSAGWNGWRLAQTEHAAVRASSSVLKGAGRQADRLVLIFGLEDGYLLDTPCADG